VHDGHPDLVGQFGAQRLGEAPHGEFAGRVGDLTGRGDQAEQVGVTVVHPGGIRTGIAVNARVAAAVSGAQAQEGKASFAKALSYPPEKAAAEIVEAIEQRRPRLLIALSARIPDLLARLTPGRYSALLAVYQRRSARRR
jgi:short-subunit dehydrogenase